MFLNLRLVLPDKTEQRTCTNVQIDPRMLPPPPPPPRGETKEIHRLGNNFVASPTPFNQTPDSKASCLKESQLTFGLFLCRVTAAELRLMAVCSPRLLGALKRGSGSGDCETADARFALFGGRRV